jgi:hypothetical protein
MREGGEERMGRHQKGTESPPCHPKIMSDAVHEDEAKKMVEACDFKLSRNHPLHSCHD